MRELIMRQYNENGLVVQSRADVGLNDLNFYLFIYLNDVTHSPLFLQFCSCLHVIKVQPSPVSDMSSAALFAVCVRCWA